MKRLLVVVLVLGLITGLFAGCGNKVSSTDNSTSTAVEKAASAASTAAAEPAAPEKKNVTLSLITSQGWLQDSEKELGKRFEEETGIKVDYQIIPADQYNNVMLTKLNTGELSDIFGNQSGRFDIVSQLNIEKNGVDLSGEEWASRMDPLAVKELTVNGKLYGITISDLSMVWAVMYNKSIFTKLNLKVPTNYEEFKTICQTIKDSGITPIYEPVSDGWHHVLWFPEIGPRFEEVEPGLADKLNSNTGLFADSSIMEKCLTQLDEMVKLGYFGKNYMSNTNADTEKNMASLKYAMVMTHEAMPDSIQKGYPDVKADNFAFFVNPLVDNQILNVNPAGPSKFIYSGSKKIEEAKQYFRYLTKQENLQYMVDSIPAWNTLCFSGVKDKYSTDVKDFYNRYTTKGTVFQTQIKYMNSQWSDMGKDIAAMFSGQKTPKEMLKSIDKRRADQAKAAKDPAWTK